MSLWDYCGAEAMVWVCLNQRGKKDAITIHLVKIFIQRNGDLSFNLIVNMVAQKESEKRVMLFIHVKKEKLSLVFN